MLPSELSFYLPPDQELLVIYPCKSKERWSAIRFRGTTEQFDESCDDEMKTEVASIDVVNDGELIVVVCSPTEEEDETDE